MTGFLGARYKKFPTMTEAEEFIKENAITNVIDNRQISAPVTSDKMDNRSPATGSREKMKLKSRNGGMFGYHEIIITLDI